MNKKAKNKKAKNKLAKDLKAKYKLAKDKKAKYKLAKDKKAKSQKSKGFKSKRLFSNGIQKSKVQCKGIIAGVVPMGKKMVICLFIWNQSHRLEILREWTSIRQDLRSNKKIQQNMLPHPHPYELPQNLISL